MPSQHPGQSELELTVEQLKNTYQAACKDYEAIEAALLSAHTTAVSARRALIEAEKELQDLTNSFAEVDATMPSQHPRQSELELTVQQLQQTDQAALKDYEDLDAALHPAHVIAVNARRALVEAEAKLQALTNSSAEVGATATESTGQASTLAAAIMAAGSGIAIRGFGNPDDGFDPHDGGTDGGGPASSAGNMLGDHNGTDPGVC